MKIVYFGTPPFAAKVLEHLLNQGVDIAAVISKPDRPKGRSGSPVPTPVKVAAQQLRPSIPVFQPEIVSDPAFASTLEQFQADLFVVVAYGEIIKQHLLDMPKLACINLHASLLPKYRGAAPIQRCIINGEKETGVSIMHMVKKMDAGDVIKMVTVPIGPNMTFGDLENELCEVGKQALLDVIHQFEKDTPLREPQDHSLMTLAPKIELEDCQIDWSHPAQAIHNLVRGVNPYPGAWCWVKVGGETKRMKVHRTALVSSAIPINKGNLVAQCGDGHLELLEVQLEGKKALSSADLLRGIGKLELLTKG